MLTPRKTFTFMFRDYIPRCAHLTQQVKIRSHALGKLHQTLKFAFRKKTT